MDGWPSGYGASFRISFQSLVFGRGFEPHSIQNLGASVLPVLAVFPFCPCFFSLLTIRCSSSCSIHRLGHPYRGLEIMHIIGSNWRQAVFIGLELQNILPDSGSPTWFSSSFKISDRPPLSITNLTSTHNARLERATQMVHYELCRWADSECRPDRLSNTCERPTTIPPIQPRNYQSLCSFFCLTPKRPSIPYTDR
jgi:hypothetical protein